jgi:hypothetical protein
VCVVYGIRVMGFVGASRRSGGRIKVLIALSALDVRRLVPSADLGAVRLGAEGQGWIIPLGAFEVINL